VKLKSEAAWMREGTSNSCHAHCTGLLVEDLEEVFDLKLSILRQVSAMDRVLSFCTTKQRPQWPWTKMSSNLLSTKQHVPLKQT